MPGAIDRQIEDHRRDTDPHPRWKAQVEAQVSALQALIDALQANGNAALPSDDIPQDTSVNTGNAGTSAAFARGDHAHRLVLPDELNAIINMTGHGVAHRNVDGSWSGELRTPGRVAVWDVDGVGGGTDDLTYDGTKLTTPSLLATDQSGSGFRAVFVQADGTQADEPDINITDYGELVLGYVDVYADGTPVALPISYVEGRVIGYKLYYDSGAKLIDVNGPLWMAMAQTPGVVGDKMFLNGSTEYWMTGTADSANTMAGAEALAAGKTVNFNAPGVGVTFYIAFIASSYDDCDPSTFTRYKIVDPTIMVPRHLNIGMDVSITGNLKVSGQAGTGTRLVAASADGTQVAQTKLTFNGTTLDIDAITRTNSLRVDDQAGSLERMVIAQPNGTQAAVSAITWQLSSSTLSIGGNLFVSNAINATDVIASNGFTADGVNTFLRLINNDSILHLEQAHEVVTLTVEEGLNPPIPVLSIDNINGHLSFADAFTILTEAGTGQRMLSVDTNGMVSSVAPITWDGTNLLHGVDPFVRANWLVTMVSRYGATGDGTTDDLAAINAAIAAAPAGSAVKFKPGTYRISGQITITKSIFLIGDNRDVCKLVFDAGIAAGQHALIKFTGSRCGLRGLSVNGNTPTAGTWLVNLGVDGSCLSADVDDCEFINMNDRGALYAGWYNSSAAGRGNVRVRNNRFVNAVSAGAIGFYTDVTGKGVENIEVVGNKLINVSGPCCAITDTSAAGLKEDGFLNTQIGYNYISVNSGGAFGPIPVELLGHTNLTIEGNQVPSGTRGIGFAACKNVVFSRNIISNQTSYAAEIGQGNRDVLFIGNVITNCRSFVEDGTAIGQPASINVTITENVITGSGLSAIDGSARCIKANDYAVNTGWRIFSNVFKNYENAHSVISLAGAAGSGGNVVKGNTYIAETEASSFRFYMGYGDKEEVSDNLVVITANYTSANPAYALGPSVIGHNPASASNVNIRNNTVKFFGTISIADLYAYGSSSPSAGEVGIAYVDNKAIGSFAYIISFGSTSHTCICLGNDFTQATGVISVGAAIRQMTAGIYSGTSVPSAGQWVRGDRTLNKNAAINGIFAWVCTASGDFAGTPPTFAIERIAYLDQAAGTSRDLSWFTNGAKRWHWRCDSTSESGSDAGSNMLLRQVADDGTTERTVLSIKRTATGDMTVFRNSLRVYPQTATTVDFWLDAYSSGYASRFEFREGNVIRWRMEKAATTGDLSLAAYTSGGTLIDTVWSLANAASGVWTINRTIAGSNMTLTRATDATSTEVVRGDDTRLTNARTPSTHASSHQSGGGDAIKLDDLAVPDDNTDLDASTSKHGLLPKLGGGTINFLRADGSWAAPSGGGATLMVVATSDAGQSSIDSSTDLEFEDETTDTDSAWSGTTFTAPSAGRYIATVSVALTGSGDYDSIVARVGSTNVAYSPPNITDLHEISGTFVLNLAASDVVRFRLARLPGSSATRTPTAVKNRLTIMKV